MVVGIILVKELFNNSIFLQWPKSRISQQGFVGGTLSAKEEKDKNDKEFFSSSILSRIINPTIELCVSLGQLSKLKCLDTSTLTCNKKCHILPSHYCDKSFVSCEIVSTRLGIRWCDVSPNVGRVELHKLQI